MVFDEGNLVSCPGLIPVMALAEQVDLSQLLDDHVRFTDERICSGGANPAGKLTAVIAGLAASADSIDDLVRREVAPVQWTHCEGGAAVGP